MSELRHEAQQEPQVVDRGQPRAQHLPRQEQVAQVSRRLKFMAKELKIPVVALAQVNRSSEDRQDHRPRLADLRESGCLAGDTLIDVDGVKYAAQGCICFCSPEAGQVGYEASLIGGGHPPGVPPFVRVAHTCPGCNSCPSRPHWTSTFSGMSEPIDGQRLTPDDDPALSCSGCPDGDTQLPVGGAPTCVCASPDRDDCLRGNSCYTDSGALSGKDAVMAVCQQGYLPSGLGSATGYVPACSQACGAAGGTCMPAAGCSSAPGIPSVNPGGIVDGTFQHDPGSDVLCVCNGQ